MATSVADVRATASAAYAHAAPIERALAAARPLICPFHVLVDSVPRGAGSMLDIGCGTGLFLNALAAQEQIRTGLGIDVSEWALTAARRARDQLACAAELRFERQDVAAGLPAGPFEVVSMIDVMHHIPPPSQRAALIDAADRVAAGGTFIYKDMVARPRWRAWANRAHDLLLARQWISYLPLAEVLAVMAQLGFELVRQERIDMWWYGHELAVFRQSAVTPGGRSAHRFTEPAKRL